MLIFCESTALIHECKASVAEPPRGVPTAHQPEQKKSPAAFHQATGDPKLNFY
jgi:hypothetical protein